MKSAFLNGEKPLLCAMILCRTPQECIVKIKASLADGAEAFGIQIDNLEKQYHTKACLTEIFEACEGRPIYATSYRVNMSTGYTDEECMALLKLSRECGATLCDVMGDTYSPSPLELTRDEEAVKKQKSFIAELKAAGAEVLMSCHTQTKLTAEQTLEIALAQQERGADVIKIVNITDSLDDMPECIRTILLLKEKLEKPFLYLVNGPCCNLIRQAGPNLGVCMYLCVQHHGPWDPLAQPCLKNMKAIRDNMVF